MNFAVLILLVCGHPAAVYDVTSGRYAEFPAMDTAKASELILQMTGDLQEAKIPYLLRDIGRDCE